MPVGPAVVDDPHDLGLEAHVEHSVRLVEDDVCDSPQIRHLARVGRQHVDHPSRGAHYDLSAWVQFQKRRTIKMTSMQTETIGTEMWNNGRTSLEFGNLLRYPGSAVDTHGAGSCTNMVLSRQQNGTYRHY